MFDPETVDEALVNLVIDILKILVYISRNNHLRQEHEILVTAYQAMLDYNSIMKEQESTINQTIAKVLKQSPPQLELDVTLGVWQKQKEKGILENERVELNKEQKEFIEHEKWLESTEALLYGQELIEDPKDENTFDIAEVIVKIAHLIPS